MTNSDKANKAIEECDLLFVDGVLVRPFSLDKKLLSYQELSFLETCTCNIDNVEVLTYEEGA